MVNWASLWRDHITSPTLDGFIVGLREARSVASSGEQKIINSTIGSLETAKGRVWKAISPRAKAWFKWTVGESPSAFGLRVAPSRYRGNPDYVPGMFTTRLNIRLDNEERQMLNDFTKDKKHKSHSDAIRSLIRTTKNPLQEELLKKGEKAAIAAAKGAVGGVSMGVPGAVLGAAKGAVGELLKSEPERTNTCAECAARIADLHDMESQERAMPVVGGRDELAFHRRELRRHQATHRGAKERKNPDDCPTCERLEGHLRYSLSPDQPRDPTSSYATYQAAQRALDAHRATHRKGDVENPAKLNLDMTVKGESIGHLSGGSLDKAVTKEIIQIVMKDKKSGEDVRRIPVDPQTRKPTRWNWALMDKNGKEVPVNQLQWYQKDPDTGKLTKVSPEEPNIGSGKTLEITEFLPASDERRYIVGEVYEITSTDSSQIKQLWRIAKYLKEHDLIGVTEVVWRKGTTRHGAILSPLISKKKGKFGLLMKVVNARYPIHFPMKIPSGKSEKEAPKIKRKKLFGRSDSN